MELEWKQSNVVSENSDTSTTPTNREAIEMERSEMTSAAILSVQFV